MKTVCEKDLCAGCMACVDICPKNAITIKDELRHYNAVIGNSCINCGACHQVCQKNYSAKCIEPQQWYQGWAKQDAVRMSGSSGGLAVALSKAFIKTGGKVCSCTFENGKFGFSIVNRIEELEKFAGSKYVKSDPSGIYKVIKERLRLGKKLLFIGLPCQVSALQNFVGKNLEENLTTVDLICHGTPSPKILELFLQQYNIKLAEGKKIRFRVKGKFGLEKDSERFTPRGVCDRYLISFLNALTYTENCYNCQYAKLERVSDITLGDSWGSELDSTEWKKGISLILCQTTKGQQLIENANLTLLPVDLENAVKHNHQLEHPSLKSKKRDMFFNGLKKNRKFNNLVYAALPKVCLKQDIKSMLIRAHIIQGGVTYQIEFVRRENLGKIN